MEKFASRKVKILFVLAFLIGFSDSIWIYIASNFFKEHIGQENVSIFYVIVYAIGLILLLNLHKFVKRWSKSGLIISAAIGKIASLIILLFNFSPLINLAVSVCYLIFYLLLFVGLDIVLESYSSDKLCGRIRGAYLTLSSLGFIFGPLVSTRILENYDYQGIFIILLFLHLVILSVIYFKVGRVNHEFNRRETALVLVRRAWKNKNIMRIYYISFALEFFYALMIIYTPLYLRNLGFSWQSIGTIFAIMLIPFVFIQFPLGYLADKKTGEKELLIVSTFWLAAITAIIYFIKSDAIFVWAGILFLTRIGAAAIEILRDSYFYKQVDGSDVDLIDFYRTAGPVAFLSASAISAVALLFLPMKVIYLVVAFVILPAVLFAYKLKNSLVK